MDTNEKTSALPMLFGDACRWATDIALHGSALACGGYVFVQLWRVGAWWARALAFPAAFGAVVLTFAILAILFALIFVRRIRPGVYSIRKANAVPWIVGESFMLILQRSFLGGYVEDFWLPRFLLYRALGAKVDATFLMGGKARILDPWALEVGRDATIGAYAVVCGHAIEGDALVVKPVKIGRGATVGVRSVLLPGVEIGEGAIVGAGALVAKDTVIPVGEIWAGVPARKIGVVDDEGRANAER